MKPKRGRAAPSARNRRGWIAALVGGAAVVLAVVALAAPSFISLAAAAPASNPAAGWGSIRPWDDFFSVAFAPPDRWFVVGEEGVMLTSTDQGKTWTRRELAKRGNLSWYDLYSIRFAKDGENGWISGEHGIILHTADGGKTWTLQKSGTDERIFRIVAIDARHAAGAGGAGVMLTTDDGGANWKLTRLKKAMDFFDVAFPDVNNGWAVGEFETIVHTADGGKTWTLQRGGDRSKFRLPALMAVRFLDDQHGWATGQGGVILKTSDGGKTWTEENSSVRLPLYGATLASHTGSDGRLQLWLAGDNGNIVRISTADGARPFTTHPTFSSLADIAFHGAIGIAVGSDGTVLRSTDGGQHWSAVGVK